MTLEELAGHLNAKYIYIGQPITPKELEKLLKKVEYE